MFSGHSSGAVNQASGVKREAKESKNNQVELVTLEESDSGVEAKSTGRHAEIMDCLAQVQDKTDVVSPNLQTDLTTKTTWTDTYPSIRIDSAKTTVAHSFSAQLLDSKEDSAEEPVMQQQKTTSHITELLSSAKSRTIKDCNGLKHSFKRHGRSASVGGCISLVFGSLVVFMVDMATVTWWCTPFYNKAYCGYLNATTTSHIYGCDSAITNQTLPENYVDVGCESIWDCPGNGTSVKETAANKADSVGDKAKNACSEARLSKLSEVTLPPAAIGWFLLGFGYTWHRESRKKNRQDVPSAEPNFTDNEIYAQFNIFKK